MPHNRVVRTVLQRYWRLTRGLTLGAQGVVLTPDDRVLLVRHTYRPGWHFPGGGVEKGETARTALERELQEEAGIELTGEPGLHGIFTNFRVFPGDHIVLYVVRAWRQPAIPPPNREIAEQRLFPVSSLDPEAGKAVRQRIAEIAFGAPRIETWLP